MGLFNNKNPNETAFTGGQKHWADVIKNTGSGELLIWRQPEEDFNTKEEEEAFEDSLDIRAESLIDVLQNGLNLLREREKEVQGRARNELYMIGK